MVKLRNHGTVEFFKRCVLHRLQKRKCPKPDLKAVSYGNHSDQCFDLWFGNRKKEGGGGPGLIFFHGGGFIKGNRFYSKLMRLAHQQGVTVISAGYRLSSSKHFTIEDSIEDAAGLLRFLGDNAAEFQLNPERIAVSGNSAGGTIALCLAVLPKVIKNEHTPRVVCATAYNAPTVLDPVEFEKLMGLPSIEPFWYLWSKLFNAQAQSDLATDRVRAMIEKISPELHISPSAAPCYVDYAEAPPDQDRHSYDQKLVSILHSAKFGQRFFDAAQKKGALCKFSHPQRVEEEKQIDFLLRYLGVKIS